MTRWIFVFILMGSGGYLFGASDTLINKNENTKVVTSENPALNVNSGNTFLVQRWNFHIQNTYIGQGDPAFPAKYSG